MRVRTLIAAAVLALAAFAVLKLGHRTASGRHAGSAPGAAITPNGVPAAAWDASRWQPGETAANLRLLALDGRTAVGMLDRGANRPLILILATPGSPALDRCASRWRGLFEIYKDRVDFLTVFVAAPVAAPAETLGRVHSAARAAVDTRTADAVRQRVNIAMTFAQCNEWRIPVLVDAEDGGAAAAYGTAPHRAVLLDEGRRRLGAPVAADVPGDLDAMSAWLRHRFEP